MSDAPGARPDLDALVEDLQIAASDAFGAGLRVSAHLFGQAAAALAAEQARADQAHAVVAEMSDDDGKYPLEAWWRGRIMRALTGERGADQ